MALNEAARVLTINSCPQNTLLRGIWEELGRRYPPQEGKSILIYGAGKFTKRVFRFIISLQSGPIIVGIADDNAIPGQTLAGHSVLKPCEFTANSFSAVLLGTDYHEDQLAEKCLVAYGSTRPMVRYSELSEYVLTQSRSSNDICDKADIFHPGHGDPLMDISTIWHTAYGFMKHHECNDFKDNILLAIALNIKTANTERLTEYGFALRHLPDEGGELLDIGSSDSMFPGIVADKGFAVTCLDPIAKLAGDPRVRFVEGDIRKTGIPDRQFDVITCISTLEHIGLPGRYGITDADPCGERSAMTEMHRLLKPGGKLILTVPFGQYAMLPLNRVYTYADIMNLKGPLHVVTEEFYCIDRDGLYLPATAQEASTADLRLDGYYALGCFVFARSHQ